MTILYGYKKKEKGSEWEKERKEGGKKGQVPACQLFFCYLHASKQEKKKGVEEEEIVTRSERVMS